MLASVAKLAVQATPDGMAMAIVRALAGRIAPARLTAAERAAIQDAERLVFGTHGRHVAWSWGSGPVVVFVHGWGGSAAQMAPLAQQVARQGFRSVAIDVTGHGSSPGRRTRWRYFLRDIAAFSASVGGEVFAYVGHSAGGLTMMAARALFGVSARRYICVCAPSYPFPPIIAVARKLAPRPGVISRYKEHIAADFKAGWADLEAGAAFAGAGSDLLLVYDQADRYIDHHEGDRLQALCPGARLIKTEGHGHLKILAAPELPGMVADFLRGGS